MPVQTEQLLHSRYRIVRNIKSGGMGAVHEAVDLRLANSPCAVKVILDSANQGEDAAYIRSRFQAEMQALVKLQHPYIPRIRDFFEEDGSLYIVMDLIQGQSLDEELRHSLLHEGRPLDAEEVVKIGLHVLEVLDYLHSQTPPVLHRDIKPANLIRDKRTGQIIVVDFGLAREMDARTQTTVGTVGYCAVEQMQGRAEPRSDLYSLGATMHHLLSGNAPAPFQIDRLSEGEYPPKLSQLIHKATAIKASERFENAREMRSELSTVFLASAGPAPATPLTVPRPVMAAVALGMAALLGLGWMAQQKPVEAAADPSPAATETIPVIAATLDSKPPAKPVKQPDFIRNDDAPPPPPKRPPQRAERPRPPVTQRAQPRLEIDGPSYPQRRPGLLASALQSRPPRPLVGMAESRVPEPVLKLKYPSQLSGFDPTRVDGDHVNFHSGSASVQVKVLELPVAPAEAAGAALRMKGIDMAAFHVKKEGPGELCLTRRDGREGWHVKTAGIGPHRSRVAMFHCQPHGPNAAEDIKTVIRNVDISR